MQSRRNFIKNIGLGAAALTLPKINIHGSIIKNPKLGIQLYTLRNEINPNFEKTIKKIAEIGYKGIESYPLPENISLEYAAKIFRQEKLEVFSIHSGLPTGKELDLALRTADIYNSKMVVYHGWPQDQKYKGLDNLKATVELYNNIGDNLNSHGLEFGLHNHWWEFEEIEGITPFYYLREHLNENIFFELDTYWTKTAGRNPAKVIKDFGSRAKLLHIKDGPAIKGDTMNKQLPVGSGTLDFNRIYESCKNSTEWMVVEFDEYAGNIFEGIETSYNYLVNNNFADGNK